MSSENYDTVFTNDENFPEDGSVVMQPLDIQTSRRGLGKGAMRIALAIGTATGLAAASEGLAIADLQQRNTQLEEKITHIEEREAARVNTIRKQDFEDGINLLFNVFVDDTEGYGQAIGALSIDQPGIATIEKALMNGKRETRLTVYENIQPAVRQVVAERHPDKNGQWQLEMQLMLAYVAARTTVVPDDASKSTFYAVDDGFRTTQILNTIYAQELPGMQAIAPQIRQNFIDQLLHFTPVYQPK